MLLLSAAVMILTVRLTVASDLDSLEAAAEQGDVEAQFDLGYMYSSGEGVPQTMPRRCNGLAGQPNRGMPKLDIG